MSKEGFGQQDYRIVEFLVIKVVVILAARLLECSVKDLNSVLIRDHIPFNCQQEELSDIHQTVLIS